MLLSLAVLLIALVGLLMYILAANPKVVEVGRILFFSGALATCLVLGGKMTRVL